MIIAARDIYGSQWAKKHILREIQVKLLDIIFGKSIEDKKETC